VLRLVTIAMTVNLIAPPASLALTSRAMVAQSAGTLARVNACSLLPKEEVKKHLPWEPALDHVPLDEEEIGKSGSGCGYPSVHVQVLTNPQSMIDVARKRGGLETIDGIGDDAYYYNNRDAYAELYVRVGQRMLTLQADVGKGEKAESVKPGVLSLAKALVSKLPR
jgi:hypothetical protein